MNCISINIQGLRIGEKKDKHGWLKRLCHEFRINFLGIVETKMVKMDMMVVRALWGNNCFDYASSMSRGYSGGILCIWNPQLFVKNRIISHDHFMVIKGVWKHGNVSLQFIVVYAPQDYHKQVLLWYRLTTIIRDFDGESILMGDFNVVRMAADRFGSVFDSSMAEEFNHFIDENELVDPPLGGYKFTWINKMATKMSKIDRFLFSEGVLDVFPNLNVLALDKGASDHRPLLLQDSRCDYGAIPFRFFHSWMDCDDFEGVVETSWNSAYAGDLNPMIIVKNKLKRLKDAIKDWNSVKRKKETEKKLDLIAKINFIEKKAEVGMALVEELEDRQMCIHDLECLKKAEKLDLVQKAKVKWSVEGDENSKFFHGFINSRRRVLAIRGVKVNGYWEDSPKKVKDEFKRFFEDKFKPFMRRRPVLEFEFLKKLNGDQRIQLEATFSNEEITRAVWDCGSDKSPGPDGFSFGFFKKFWKVIEGDIVEAVKYFHRSNQFPKGCNSSFITLIPKVIDPVSIRDYRPICLIGGIYKIISKILANRLTGVMDDVISNEQSAFLKGRQIMDGPLILNEVLNWCKLKKTKTMVFKVDFEKAYDSVCWDFLQDVMKKMGFGSKWCAWIRECLKSSMASVLVNGSPTDEFRIFRGLRQGDPLSPFLFLLVMEALHNLVERAKSEGHIHGVSIGEDGFMVSHLFYADDAVFIGKWSNNNVHHIVRLLQCFFLVSGLKINIGKSRLMGVGVQLDEIQHMARLVGCDGVTLPFVYLGVKVGANMNRVAEWSDVLTKFRTRLSKWKANTLSAGGRLTLIKSVLGSIAIYPMSIFKTPTTILNLLESIRNRFFIGADGDEKKLTWVKWKKVLASKKDGGLGVGSLYASNRALLYKWK